MSEFIYKICSRLEWKNFKKKKIFYGTKKDLLDGYVHLSKKNQVKKTLKKYFFKKGDLILLKIKALELRELKWEKSKEGEFFPHLYSFLRIEDIECQYKISLLKNGLHSIN
jgi:uncharacterized protein (DUF952 family)